MSWPIVTLGELALSVRNGMFASRPTDEPPGTRILRISAVRDGRVNNADSKFVANLMSDQIEKFSVRPGDLLVTRYNGSRSLVGISGIVPPHEDPIVYPDKLIRIVVDRSLADPRFVNYQFQSSHVRAYLGPRIRTTAGQSGINGADLRSVPLALPPCEEQRRIVDLLEDHLSRLDAARRWVGQARIKLDALVRSSLEAQFSGDNVVPLSELIDVRPGPSRSPNTHPVTTPPGGDRAVILVAPQQLRFRDDVAEVTGRPVVARGPRDRQHPLGRHPTLGFRDPLGDQLGHRIVIVGPLSPRWGCDIAGLELLDDPFDGPMSGAAQLGGSPVNKSGRTDIFEVFGRNPDVAEVDAYVRTVMQEALDRLARQRRFPVLG